ncbi:uncharacterized protein zmp:0000000991 isoform X2 [Clarias gariepinus]|nr:uncharacterized protein zmp:0000000991 isoform X2 [Clarias gariepinus]
MFTSTIVSVLAPHWSGRLRRHKRGFSDVGPDTAQSTNQSALSQNEQQQRFPLQQIQAQSGVTRSSDEWQNESFSHLSESKSQFLKTSSVRMNKHAEDQRTEFMRPLHVSMDSSEVPRPAMSLQVHNYRRMAQSVDQGDSFSSLRSRPTTSTLLLSSRRMNSRKPIPQSFQMNRQLSASISSLNLPSKSILRSSQPQLNLVSSNNPAEETLLRKNFLASSDQLSVTHKPKALSPNWAERDFSSKHRYLITGNFDKTPPTTDDTTRERLFSNYTRFNQSETLKSATDHGAVDRRITSTKTVQDFSCRISERSGMFSPKENANSVFVFPQPLPNFNSDSVLKRQVSKISMTSTNRKPSTFVQSNIINNMNNSSMTSTTNSSTGPRTNHPFATSPSVSLTPAPMTQADQNNVQNSSKPSSSPVNSLNIRTFTESLNFSPLKDSVEERSPSHLWSNYLNSKRQENVSNQSPLDEQSPLSTSEFKPRRVCIPSIYTYLRETSSPKSTQVSPALSSPSPQNVSLKQIQEENKNSRKLQFTFDLNSFESQDPPLKPDSSSTSAPQSLPPDTGKKTVSRISQSPYSTLISTREAVKSISSPPVGQQHSRSLSYGSSPVDAKSSKVGKRSYTSVIRDRMNQRKVSLGEQVGATNIQPAAETDSVYQDRVSKSSTDAKFPDCQTNTLIPTATHPKQTDMSTTVITNIPHEEHNGIFLSWGDKNNTYANDTLNAKDLSFSLGPSLVSEEMQREALTGTAQTNQTFQESQSSNSKKSLFSMRSKKENALSSSPSASKEGLAVKNGEMTGVKTKKVDQVLNRLRQTFGGRFSEDSDITNKRKTKKEEAFNIKAFESVKKEKESDHLTVTRQIKPEEVLDVKTSERARKLDRTVNQTVRTQAKPEEVLDIKGSERTRNLDETVDLTVRTRTKPEEISHRKTTERNRKRDQTVDMTFRTQTKPEKVLGIIDSERTKKLDQMIDLTFRTQTIPEKVLDIKDSERTRKLDQMVAMAFKTQTKPEEVLNIKASERTRKLDQTGDLTFRTQTKPEEVLDSMASERTNLVDQTDDFTVRRKINNKTCLDIMTSKTRRKAEQRLSSIQTVKSPNSPKTLTKTITFMTDPCDSSSTKLDFRHEKQDTSSDNDNHKRLEEERRNQLLAKPLSPNWLAPDNINFYATLPLGKRSRLGPSPTLSPYECFSEDEQSDNVFFSNVLTKKKNTSFGESENVAQQNNSVKIWEQKSSGVKVTSPCADLKYGLHRGRSVSVSSVVSGRPSGPGRISTGSRQSSISDLSSLDGFVPKSRHSSMNSPVGSPENQISYKGPSGRLSSEGLLRSPDNLEAISFLWDMETDPTPPSSPPYARRMSQVSSPSSASSWTSPDSSSPRGFLPSRTYRSTLSAFKESGSESTTDDEYYLNSDDDDEKETEL